MKTRGYNIALCVIALTIVGLLWWGVMLLNLPPIYRLARMYNPILHYQAHAIIALAFLLALLHRPAARAMVWLGQEIHRLASLVMMLGAVVIDGSMHLLNIPHMEGWWLPLLGSGALISGLGAWLHQWRKECGDKTNVDSN